VFGNGLPTQCRRGDPMCYAADEKAFAERVLAAVRCPDRHPEVPAHSAGLEGCRPGLVLIVVIIAALGLSGCGREGPLELPPGPGPGTPAPSAQLSSPDGTPAPGSPQDTALKNGFDAQGNPVATPGQKRSFILDPLLR